MAYRLISRFPIFSHPNCLLRCYHFSPVNNKVVQFLLSDIGEGIREVTVRDWFVKPGDSVAQFDDICLVESDKAAVNITSRFDGTIKKVYYATGEKAFVGKPLVDIDVKGTDVEIAEKEAKSPDAPRVHDTPESHDIDKHKSLATPSVRKIAKEYQIQLNEVKGSGKGGRVVKEDLLRYLNIIDTRDPKEAATTHKPREVDIPKQRVPPQSTSKDVPYPLAQDKVIPITGVMKAMFDTMTRSGDIPTFGYSDEVSVTKLITLRQEVKEMAEKWGFSLTFMPFFIKAASKALEAYPTLNASVDSEGMKLILRARHNIGVAMDTKSGLVVPNIKDVQSKTILDIAKELDRLMTTGKKGIFNPADISGGTFTLSNIGVIGGTYARPLMLPTEVAIVALGRFKTVPAFSPEGEIVKENILCVSWAGDHRVLDGATIARFGTLWKSYIENPSILILDLK